MINLEFYYNLIKIMIFSSKDYRLISPIIFFFFCNVNNSVLDFEFTINNIFIAEEINYPFTFTVNNYL